MSLADKLEALGNRVGQRVLGRPEGEKLVRHFVDSLVIPKTIRFRVEMRTGHAFALHGTTLRKIIVTGCPRVISGVGAVGKEEAALALIRWRVVRRREDQS
jgi:hypothetical protein